jgi:hypothetical protein
VFITDGILISIRKIRIGLISVENYPICRRPLNPKGRVIPSEAPRMFRSVELGHLVEDFGIVFHRLKPMGEAFRNIQHLPVFGRQDQRKMLLERGGFSTKIDNGVVNRSSRAPYELCFFVWCDLKVHSAKRALPLIE